ncbi:MAG TPA: glycosyltransferase family 1 protein, partial [Sphingomicrobium sp.]
ARPVAVTGALTIGVDTTTWWNKRGFGRFTRGQLGAMLDEPRGHRFVLFVDQEPVEEMLRPNVDVVRVKTSATVTDSAVADGSRSIRDLLAFRREASGRPLDVFWFPAVYSWYPVSGRIPTVVTFHDAIAEHHTKLVLPTLRGRLFWNLKVWLAKRSARHIATVSEAAREEISVILEAADARFHPITGEQELQAARKSVGLPLDRRLILYVGGLAPHKNLVGLLEGYAAAVYRDDRFNNLDLVLAGDPKGDGFHSNVEELHALVATHGLKGRVHFPGFVPDAILPALYSDALAVAMPAFSEGFGLPAAEAIACGTPVIATAGGAVAEVVGKARLFFDPFDPGDISNAIKQIAGDPALLAQLKAECLPRAAELSWSHSASAMIDLLEAHARRRA